MKKIKKKTPVSKHMQQLSDRYNPRTKILTTEKGERLKKYAHGYFNLYNFNKSKLTTKVQTFLKSYPKWHLKQNQTKSEDFQFFFKIMVQAHPQQLTLFQEKQFNQSIYKSIEHIRFPYLKELQINIQYSVNIEAIAWLQAPALQNLLILSNGQLAGISPLAKCNFKNLNKIKLKSKQISNSGQQNYDLEKASRIKMYRADKNEGKYNFSTCSISIFRPDFTDIGILSKIELQKLPNFTVFQEEVIKGDPMINMEATFESLNRKFQNVTFYHKIQSNQLYALVDDLYEDFSSDGSEGSYYGGESDDEGYGNRYFYDQYDFDSDGYDPINLGCPNHYDNWNDDF